MAKLIFALLLIPSFVHALQIQFKAVVKTPKLDKISGLVFDEAGGSFYAVSSARKFSRESQIIQLKIQLEPFGIASEKATLLTVNPTEFSHPKKKATAQSFANPFRLRGIALTKWGDFILINPSSKEHSLFSVHPDGLIQGDLERSNKTRLDFSAIAGSRSGNEWMISDQTGIWQHYKSLAAWAVKPDFELHYPVTASQTVAGFVYWTDQLILVLESNRSGGQIFEVSLKNMNPDHALEKKLVLDLKDLQGKLAPRASIGGMALGPTLSSGERSLILVSHGKSVRDQGSQFLLFAVKE